MKKTVIMATMLGLLAFGCEGQLQPQETKTKKMQPSQMEDQDYNQRRKPRSQGGCCGAGDLQAPQDLQSETADATEIQVETAE